MTFKISYVTLHTPVERAFCTQGADVHLGAG